LQLTQHWDTALTSRFPFGQHGLALMVTLLLAWMCHLAWEEPWRRYGRRQARRLEAAD
jgi:peptidoglycan/LPS O-acetylase OafA/YrhL